MNSNADMIIMPTSTMVTPYDTKEYTDKMDGTVVARLQGAGCEYVVWEVLGDSDADRPYMLAMRLTNTGTMDGLYQWWSQPQAAFKWEYPLRADGEMLYAILKSAVNYVTTWMFDDLRDNYC